MVTPINGKPNSNAVTLDSSGKRSNIFSLTHSNTPPSFEKQESILYEMAELIKVFVVNTQLLSIPLRRNDWYHTGFNSLENDCVCIVAMISQKIFRLKVLNQLHRKCTIRCGTRSDKELHRHTMRASTAKCILVLSSLLFVPSPGFRFVRQRCQGVS